MIETTRDSQLKNPRGADQTLVALQVPAGAWRSSCEQGTSRLLWMGPMRSDTLMPIQREGTHLYEPVLVPDGLPVIPAIVR